MALHRQSDVVGRPLCLLPLANFRILSHSHRKCQLLLTNGRSVSSCAQQPASLHPLRTQTRNILGMFVAVDMRVRASWVYKDIYFVFSSSE